MHGMRMYDHSDVGHFVHTVLIGLKHALSTSAVQNLTGIARATDGVGMLGNKQGMLDGASAQKAYCSAVGSRQQQQHFCQAGTMHDRRLGAIMMPQQTLVGVCGRQDLAAIPSQPSSADQWWSPGSTLAVHFFP